MSPDPLSWEGACQGVRVRVTTASLTALLLL